MHWSLRSALKLTVEEAAAAERRAARIEEAARPDGAREYVPHTPAYAARHLYGRKALASIGVNWRDVAA